MWVLAAVTVVTLVFRVGNAQDECIAFDVKVTVGTGSAYLAHSVNFLCQYDAHDASSIVWSMRRPGESDFRYVYKDSPQTDIVQASAGPLPDFKNSTRGYFLNRTTHSLILSKATQAYQNTVWRCVVATPIRCYLGIPSNNFTLTLKESYFDGPWLQNSSGSAISMDSILNPDDILTCTSESAPEAKIILSGSAFSEVYDTVCEKVEKAERWRCSRWGKFSHTGTVICNAQVLGETHRFCTEQQCHLDGINVTSSDPVVNRAGSPSTGELPFALITVLFSILLVTGSTLTC